MGEQEDRVFLRELALRVMAQSEQLDRDFNVLVDELLRVGRYGEVRALLQCHEGLELLRGQLEIRTGPRRSR